MASEAEDDVSRFPERRLIRVLVPALLVVAVASMAFVVGRTTAPSSGAPETSTRKNMTLRSGDQFRVPSIALFCSVNVELYRPASYRPVLRCYRETRRPSWEAILARDRTRLVRIGDPGDQRVFPEQR